MYQTCRLVSGDWPSRRYKRFRELGSGVRGEREDMLTIILLKEGTAEMHSMRVRDEGPAWEH